MKKTKLSIICQLTLVTLFVPSTLCANVFISVTYGEGSHYMSSTAIGEELVKRGHNVTYLISNAYLYRTLHPVHSKLFHYEVFNHSVSLDKVYKRTREIAAYAFENDFNMDALFTLQLWLNPLIKDCRAALNDEALLQRLRNADFDITIIDITWACSVLLNAYVGSPTVVYNPLASQYLLAELAGAPFMPAIIPEGIWGTPQKMNFKQRLGSLLMTLAAKYFTFAYFVDMYDPLRHEFGILEDQTLMEFLAKADLSLSNSDPVIDLLMPLPPAVVEVGGLLTRSPVPLEEELEEFMNSSGVEGVIVLSLGTYVKVMPQRLNDMFASVFAKLPQKVVWQLPDNSSTELSNNIKTMEWLPQNDLLGHPKTKLLVYQGGNNGLYEALYNGVPTLVLPVFADQLSVAARVTEKGMGLSINIHSLTAERLETSINTITGNITFAQTAKRLSAIYRSRPDTPAERAAFWVEHVLKFGGKHMQSSAKDMNFVQLYLLDVIIFLLVFFIVMLVVIMLTCMCVFRCCRRSCEKVFGSKSKQD